MEDIIKDLEIAEKRLNISVAGLKAIIEELELRMPGMEAAIRANIRS